MILAVAMLAGCSRDEPEVTTAPEEPAVEADEALSPSARPELHATLLEDSRTPRHPSDGGGTVRLLEGTQPTTAGRRGRWKIAYAAGPLGVAEGGRIYLQIPAFWGWSPPQTTNPEAPGYTRVFGELEGVKLTAEVLDQGLLAAKVTGRALVEGEEIVFDYGAGTAMAASDTYAEHDSPFFIAVDGDGDGVRAVVPDPATVDVQAGPAAGLVLMAPSTGRPGQALRVVLAALDTKGNAGSTVDTALQLAFAEGAAKLSKSSVVLGEDGTAAITVTPADDGILRLVASDESGPVAMSNPILVSRSAPRWVWADLHGHSQLSDGTGTPDDYFRYARDVANLEVVSLTDHDHWGIRPLANSPQLWAQIRDATERFHDPPQFVTLLGYEWTNWLHGHRHVLWFSDGDPGRQRIYDSVDPDYSTPVQLWNALRGTDALTIAHHSAGGPVATNWDIPPDPELEPVAEVASVHGSSEALDSPGVIYDPIQGNFVRDQLDRGYKLGFVGSGDSHDGHPGLAHLASGMGGLAALQVDELSRRAIKEALSQRRVYATNGPRIVLRATLDGAVMGSDVPPSDSAQLGVFVLGTAPLRALELIRSGARTELSACESYSCSADQQLTGLDAGEYLYVRAIQEDGGTAWSSPFFVVSPE